MSKALDESVTIRSVCLPLSIALAISSTVVISCVSQENFLRKPC